MTLDQDWFSEIYAPEGTAFSLKIKQRCHEEKTKYQKIEILETESFGHLMVIDGCIMLTQRDNFIYHEMISHPALFSHPSPEKILIIGGGDCGTLKEVLKHDSVTSVQQIEIDERVTQLSEQYFPELCESNSDPRAELMYIDGIKWVQDAPANSYDIIIIDSTDPVGPAVGLFSQSFYQQCHRILKSDGLLVQQSESPLFHMPLLKDIHSAMRGADYVDALSVFFPQCSYPSGWWSVTIACKDNVLGSFREEDVDNKSFETTYYNSAIHKAALAAPAFFYPQIID